ncbi:MAG: T9SS type A sorting domain-containing protein, partial [candidate division WOR-3 bacterium]|nr:T9SS type A sorting domain-containing protein [candidate division WOR-3 bacterium]
YAFVGNNSRRFYVYYPELDSWVSKCSIPFGYYDGRIRKKGVRKGASLAFGEDSLGREVIYALKGNNTTEFWKYDIATDNWNQLSDIRIGNQIYKIKPGSCISYTPCDSKYVFLLVGSSRNCDFLVYNITTGYWKNKGNVPDSNQFKEGSCMVAVRDSVFILKGGGKTNAFYLYDIKNDTWYLRESLPTVHPQVGKSKKVKAGASLAYNSFNNKLYAFKGGKTQEFWEYDISLNEWRALDTIPKANSAIYYGGCLACYKGRVYALKGNGTKEFWCYAPQTSFSGNSLLNKRYLINPNKLSLDFQKGTVKIYSADGRLIKFLDDKTNMIESTLPAGVYFILRTNLHNRFNRSKFVKVN